MGTVVLIETLWNVKIGNKGWLVWSNVVLIETLWNVKVHTGQVPTGSLPRINRNIVECKDRANEESGDWRRTY